MEVGNENYNQHEKVVGRGWTCFFRGIKSWCGLLIFWIFMDSGRLFVADIAWHSSVCFVCRSVPEDLSAEALVQTHHCYHVRNVYLACISSYFSDAQMHCPLVVYFRIWWNLFVVKLIYKRGCRSSFSGSGRRSLPGTSAMGVFGGGMHRVVWSAETWDMECGGNPDGSARLTCGLRFPIDLQNTFGSVYRSASCLYQSDGQ